MTIPNAAELAAISLRENGIPRDLAARVVAAPQECDLEILDAAYRVRRETFGHGVRLHVLLNAKMGGCSEDCGFCSQSARAVGETNVPPRPLLDGDAIVDAARRAHDAGAYKFCIVTATRGPSDRDLDALCPAVERIKREIPVGICCSLGILTEQRAKRLAASGVDRFNHNLETSESRYEEVCTTHTWRDRVETVKMARAAGMEACCGGILGLETNDDDILDLAYSLRELDVESIPLNFLDPRPGTARTDAIAPTPRRCIRTLAVFRLIHPRRDIRAAGGREVNLRSMQSMALYAANSIFTEGYLTTAGNRHDVDLQMIADAGFHLERWSDRAHDPAEHACGVRG
ncbi:MAG: biotin synthase BioB [Planctomycetes bacterium]|nr:biotin synthase BioB [Planctomycetota bacterium]